VLMDIEPKQFEAMYDIFKVKYGEPIAVKESEIQSRMGAKYNQKIATWTNEGLHIIFMRYADKIDEGRVFFAPVVEVDAKGKEEKDKAAADKL